MIATPLTMCGNQDMRLKIALAALAATAAFASPAYAQVSADRRSARNHPPASDAHADAGPRLRHRSFQRRCRQCHHRCRHRRPQRHRRRHCGRAGRRPARAVRRGWHAGPAGRHHPRASGQANLLNRVGGGATITAPNWDLDSGAANDTFQTRTIADVNGAFQVGVGAEFAIAASQINGLYTANFDVTAEYQ